MVIAFTEEKTRDEFTELLKNTLVQLEKNHDDSPGYYQNCTPKKFEEYVLDAMISCAAGTIFEKNIESHNEPWFPDISAKKYFGLEVKSTKKPSWCSTGSSILEGTRVEFVEEIHMLFGQLNDNPQFRTKRYQDCLSDICVTHSPRYRIDMDLIHGQTIFDKMKTSYDELRKSDHSVRQFKEYYRSNCNKGEIPWWLDDPDKSISPTTKFFADLPTLERNEIQIQAFAFFPEIIDKKDNMKYRGVASWMIVNHGVISTNLRDEFSAGGQQNLILEDKEFKDVPKIFQNLKSQIINILEFIRFGVNEANDNILEENNSETKEILIWAIKVIEHTKTWEREDLNNFVKLLLKSFLKQDELPEFN